uniref:Uncharacterized protein n=1 Tax=Desulfobacca acetoxidans TaxID=60893 RepID=A0A7C3SJ05_9BACT
MGSAFWRRADFWFWQGQSGFAGGLGSEEYIFMGNRAGIRVWSIGGGKGGIGKSILTLGLGLALTRLGRRVILIDGDLGGANLHTLVGLRYPGVTLEHFLAKQVARLEDVIIPTALDHLGLICACDDILGSANPTYQQKIRLLQEIERLPADFVLLDLGAGTAFNILDLFNYSAGKIVLCTAQTTSLQSAYGFIKAALYRKISREFARNQKMLTCLSLIGCKEAEAPVNSLAELLARLRDFIPELYFPLKQELEAFQPFLVVNMVQGEGEERIPEIIQTVCTEFLAIRPLILGNLDFDPLVEQAVNRRTPRLLMDRRSRAAAGFLQMAKRMLALGRLAFGTPEPKLREKGGKAPRPALGVLP